VNSPVAGPPVGVERVFSLAFVLVAAVAWSSFTLSEFGLFTRVRLLALLLPLVMAGAWLVLRTARTASGRGSTPAVAGLVVVLLTAGVFTARPADYLVNGSDASVYLNMASAVEARGGLRVPEPLLDSLSPEARGGLFDRDPLPPQLFDFFSGGIQVAADGATLQPNFFHLLPTAIAGFTALTGGGDSGLYLLPIAGLLTVCGVWILGIRLSSPLTAFVAAALLALNFAHIWYARYPMSEGLTGAFLVSGLLFAVRGADEQDAVSGLFAGAAFGLAALSRLEVILLVSPLIVAYLIATAIRGRWTRGSTLFAAAFGLLMTQATFHALVTTGPYTERIIWRVFATDWWFSRTTLLAPAAVAAAGVLAWLAWRRPWRAVQAPWIVRSALAVLLLAAIVRTWPQLWIGPAPLLFTPVGLIAMAFGAVWLARDRPRPEVLLLVALFVTSALVYVDAPRSGRWYPLAWRRLVPVVLPIGMLLVGHITAVLWRQRAPWRWAGIAIAGFLAVHSVRHSYVLLAAHPMSDIRDQLAVVADSLPADGVVLTDGTAPSHFGLSLHFTFGRPVLAVRNDPDRRLVDGIAATLAAEGRPITLALSPNPAPGGLTRADFPSFDLVPAFSAPLRWTELQRTANAVPSGVETIVAPLEFYTLRAWTPVQAPLTIEIGEGDFNARGPGFHAAERMGEALARWTMGEAAVHLPPVESTAPLRLVLRLAAPRPQHIPRPAAVLTLGGETIFTTAPLDPGFTEITVDLDAIAVARVSAGPTLLGIRTTPFVPRETGAGDDGRELGVVVDWIRIERWR
jgi:hypothetical protein